MIFDDEDEKDEDVHALLRGAVERGRRRREIERLNRDPVIWEFGFDRPEDGSERRYRYDRAREHVTRRPWRRFTFWWVVHNAVSHP